MPKSLRAKQPPPSFPCLATRYLSPPNPFSLHPPNASQPMSSPAITGFHLSPQQRQIWQRSEGERGTLSAQCLFTIQGDLRPPWLQKALQEIIEQHEVFRTAFQQTPGVRLPLQVIQSPGEIVWRMIDLSTAEVADPAAAMRTAQTTEQRRVAPSEPPCLRCILFKLGSQDHRLLLTLPALCADTQTYQIVLTQLSQRYGAASPWANDEPIQYAEFAEWQNQLLSETDETALAAQAFWQQQGLASHSALLPPLRYRHTQKPSFTPQVHQVDIAAEVAIALQSEFSTPAVLLTSWLCLLWRQTEQPEIAIGVACEGRQDEALALVCGPFTRFLPLQCDLSGATPFSALLRRVEQTWHDLILWQAYLPQDLPDSLVTLPVSFEFLNPVTATTPGGIKFTLDRTWVYPDRSDLKLTAVQRDERLTLEIHYNETVLSAAAISVLASQLDALLNHVSRQPAATLDTLSLSNRTQQVIQDPLRGSPRSSRDLPPRWPPRCLHQRFEQQAEQTPERVALIVEDQRLTYRELNHRANQLAHHLQQLGAGPEVIVALYLERSPELLITLLAILKAGSAYLPLDPTWPASRVTCQLKDAKAPILVTQQQQLSHGIEIPGQVVCLGRDLAGLQQQSVANPMSAVTPANLAYILYTSGSTGQPKGVAVEHRQLLTYIDSVIERLELPAAAHYAIVSTLAADLGQTMLFPCWCQGGTLHLMTPERARDAKALSDYAQQQPIDCLKIVPSHLQALLQTAHPQSLLPRQRLVLGGEACPWTLIEQVQQLAPNCRIFNHYGPTETTVGVLTYAVTAETLTQSVAATVPLGQAIANAQVYLLDVHLAPVPVGVPGEIYIGGDSVARGYLQQPGLTALRFIPNLYSTEPGARLYRTGDVARYLPDGTLEFLRRVDSQVKLHGFRIELGAIEAQLIQHPDVQAAAVLVREDTPGNPLLVAYVVLQSGAQLDTSAWRAFLHQWLPEPMIPSLFVPLPALPLTPNGKVDRRALPIPEKISPQLAAQFVAPRNPTEAAIATIWMEVLGLETVGVHSHFFDLGGHSLLATQVLSRLRETFEIELPLSQLFEARTVAEIAIVVETALLAEIETMTEADAEAMTQRAG